MTLSELDDYFFPLIITGFFIFITILTSILQHRNLGNKVETQNDVIETMVISEEEDVTNQHFNRENEYYELYDELQDEDYRDHPEIPERCQERDCQGCRDCTFMYG